MDVSFRKMQGLGNDFLVFDLRRPEALAAWTTLGLAPDAPMGAPVAGPLSTLARRLCDRHRGVGGDGLLLILPALDTAAVARMRVINADGSEAEMCGNGLRCVARYLVESGGDPRDPSIPIATGGGVLPCTTISRHMAADGPSADPLPEPLVEARLAPPTFPRGPAPIQLTADGRDFSLLVVALGNPHAVAFLPDGVDLRALALRYGPVIETLPDFPQRTNVEFARLRPRPADRAALDLFVWERGCGLTAACGTGACATAVAAERLGLHPRGAPLIVHLPGGPLTITVEPEADGGALRMQGPAVPVFHGTIDLSRFTA